MVNAIVNVLRNGIMDAGGLLGLAQRLPKKEVLVGIPAENAPREHGTTDKINNAELLWIQSHGVRQAEMRAEMQPHLDSGMAYSKAHELYIQSHGSPLWHIPPRPVLEPSVEANKERIGKQMGLAATAGLSGDQVKQKAYLEKAGIVAENAARRWFENPENGWPPNAPATIAAKGSDKPLIDTGEMRKAITHIVVEE